MPARMDSGWTHQGLGGKWGRCSGAGAFRCKQGIGQPDGVLPDLGLVALLRANIPAGLFRFSGSRTFTIGVGHTGTLQEPMSAAGTALGDEALLDTLHQLQIDEVNQPINKDPLHQLRRLIVVPCMILRQNHNRREIEKTSNSACNIVCVAREEWINDLISLVCSERRIILDRAKAR